MATRFAKSFVYVGFGLAAFVLTVTGCSDEFQSCEARRDCEGSGTDSGADASSSGGAGGGESDSSGGAGGGESSSSGGAGGNSVAGAGGMDAAGTGGMNEAGAGTDGGSDTGPCPEGFADCNGNTGDGCETDLRISSGHCGACDRACSGLGALSTECIDGACAPVCVSGWGDCATPGASEPDDGCETEIAENADHCGACNRSCSSEGAESVSCSNGTCAPTCREGRGDCVSPAAPDADDGCESSLDDDAAHCGACDRACSTAGTTRTACNGGVCAPTCANGRGDCSTPRTGLPDNGCETNLGTSAQHCGACGFACSNEHAASVACVSGDCAPECSSGFGDCTTPTAADDGCETSLNNAASCGACGKSCEGGGCSSMRCGPVLLAEMPTPSEYPATVTSSSIDLDDDYVYFVHCSLTGSVNRVAKDATSGDVLAPNEPFPTGVAVDSTHVWWTDQQSERGRVRRRPLGNSTIISFFAPTSGLYFPAAIDVDESEVAWGNYLNDTVYSSPRSSLSTLSRTATNPSAVAIAGSNVFWVASGGLYRSPLSLTTVFSLGLTQVRDASVDGSYVYWATASAIGRAHESAKLGVQEIVTEGGVRVAAHGEDLYFVTSSNRIKHALIPATGQTTAVERATTGTVLDIAADEGHVYWAENTATRLRIMKMVR